MVADAINLHVFIEGKCEYKHTVIKKGTSIGVKVTIACGITVGGYALIGAGSIITTDVPPYALVYGSPARVHGKMDEAGKMLILKRKNV